MSEQRCRVCLFNSADPRGSKVGGIETYTRDYIFYHPEDMDLLLIAADEVGDLKIGEINDVEFRGRRFKFLPLQYIDNSINVYPNSIFASETFKFAKLLVANFSKIRKILRDGNYTAEIRRVEYAPIMKAMGVPFIQMVHVWGARDKPMSGLMGKYWYLRSLTELVAAALCEKFYSVNPDMTEMYKKSYGLFKTKFDTLTTWANTEIFKLRPYLLNDDIIRVVYAGRMDKFKRPDFMFRVIDQAARLAEGKLEFHYIGDGDPAEFPEFVDIASLTTLHGRKNSIEISEILGRMHVGILTSEFEGMPRFVLEVLSSGRPVVAMHLPQLEGVIVDGTSGRLISRTDDHIAQQAQAIVETVRDMRMGKISPEATAALVRPFSPQSLLGKIFADHRRLHGLSI